MGPGSQRVWSRAETLELPCLCQSCFSCNHKILWGVFAPITAHILGPSPLEPTWTGRGFLPPGQPQRFANPPNQYGSLVNHTC